MNPARPLFLRFILSYTYVTLLFLSIPLPTQAGTDTALRVSLSKAVAMALTGNRSLAASSSRLEAARDKAAIAAGRLLPRLDARWSASRTDSPVQAFGDKLLQKRFTAADFAIPGLNNPDAINNYHTDIAVTIPVYQGGALGAARRMSEAGAEAAAQAFEAKRQTTILQVIEAFTLLRQTKAQRDAAATAVLAARMHLHNTQALVRRGIAIASDVMDARAHLLQAQVHLRHAANAVSTAMDRFQLLLGATSGHTVEPLGEPAIRLERRDASAWVATALDRHPMLEAAQHNLEAARARVDQAMAAFRPAVNLHAIEEWNSDSAVPKNPNTTLAAELQFNLFSGGSDRARLEASRAEMSARNMILAELKHRIVNNVKTAWRELDEAEKRYAAATQILKQRLESLRIRRLREQQGLERVSDVLDAQSHVDQARAEHIRARYEVIIAKARLLAAAGVLRPEVVQ